MRIFLAGGTGVLGHSLVPQLVRAGHRVTATTRRADRADMLTRLGAAPGTVDVFDAAALTEAVAAARPDLATTCLPVFASALSAPQPTTAPADPDKQLGRPVSNAKARAAGWDPAHPTWREASTTPQPDDRHRGVHEPVRSKPGCPRTTPD